MSTQKPSVKIDQWAVVPNPAAGSYRELNPGNLLTGRVFGHPRIEEGTFIFTSPLTHVDREHHLVETRNTAYILGDASVDYKAWSRKHNVAA